jgi:hypothetical protein
MSTRAAKPKARTKGAAARVPSQEQIAENLAAARQALALEGAIKVTALRPPAARDTLLATLLAEGYEHAATWLRVPLRQQLATALKHGAVLSEKALKMHVRGATAKEFTALRAEALQRGDAFLVYRGKAVALAGKDAMVLDKDSLRGVRQALTELTVGLTMLVKAKNATLLAGDVAEALAAAQAVVGKASAAISTGGSAMTAVLESVAAAREPSGLAFVPKVVARLTGELSVEEARAALLKAAELELLELRPEGGLARLNTAELAACLPGPNGTVLSWARLRQGAQQ